MADQNGSPALNSSSSIEEVSNSLYEHCKGHGDHLWFQEELLALNIIPDGSVDKLQGCLQNLCDEGLFKMLVKEETACWKVVDRAIAEKHHNLTLEESIIYSYIESSGREGIWNRTIRTRSNLHEAVCKRSLKSLESKGLVKTVTNARQSNAKFYILSHLQAPETLTGGLFYTDGTMDEEFLRHLCRWAQQYVHDRSWSRASSKYLGKKNRGKLSKEEAEVIRAEGFRDGLERSKWLPMPPGYTKYPTVSEITQAVNKTEFFKVKMKEAEVEKVLDILCWDGIMERVMGGSAYKSILSAWDHEEDDAVRQVTQAPCSRCPVFDFCDDSGPVNARTCPYFQDWLAL